MKTHLLLSVIFITIIGFACKRKSDAPTPDSPLPIPGTDSKPKKWLIKDSKTGKFSYGVVYIYDNSERLLKKQNVDSVGNVKPGYETTFEYNSEGTLSRKIEKSGTYTSTTTFSYTNKLIDQVESFSISPNSLNKATYKYTYRGTNVNSIVGTSSGITYDSIQYHGYNALGRPSTSETFHRDYFISNSTLTKVNTLYYSYDSNGNMIKQELQKSGSSAMFLIMEATFGSDVLQQPYQGVSWGSDPNANSKNVDRNLPTLSRNYRICTSNVTKLSDQYEFSLIHKDDKGRIISLNLLNTFNYVDESTCTSAPGSISESIYTFEY